MTAADWTESLGKKAVEESDSRLGGAEEVVVARPDSVGLVDGKNLVGTELGCCCLEKEAC